MENNKIINLLLDINENIKSLEKRIEILEEETTNKLKIIEKSSDNMNNHIEFVEKIYEQVKYPFHYICNKVNYISALPVSQIEN